MIPSVAYPVRMARANPESIRRLVDALADNPEDQSVRHALADEYREVGQHKLADALVGSKHVLNYNPKHTLRNWSGYGNGFYDLQSAVWDAEREMYEPDEVTFLPDHRGVWWAHSVPHEEKRATKRGVVAMDATWHEDRPNHPRASDENWAAYQQQVKADRDQRLKAPEKPVKHARASSESLQKLFDASRKSPNDASIHHALADDLDESGRSREAEWIRSGKYIIPASHHGDVVLWSRGWRKATQGVYPGAHPNHTQDTGEGPFDELEDAYHFGESELGVPYSIVPEETSEKRPSSTGDPKPVTSYKIMTEPNRMSRIKYAARERITPEQEEMKFLEAISKSPEDQSIRDAYADHLIDQGRHGEAAFFRNVRGAAEQHDSNAHQPDKGPRLSLHQVNHEDPPAFNRFHNSDYDAEGRVLMSAFGPEKRHIGWFSIEGAANVLKAAKDSNFPLERRAMSSNPQHPHYIADRSAYHKLIDGYNPSHNAGMGDEPEEPVRHAAYRAPKGGAVVRGTFYQGGKLIPDLEGDFANPPAPEQPVTPPQYPVQPKRPGLKERFRAKFGRSQPVVSYARATPESLSKLFDAVRRSDIVNPDLSIRAALADELTEAGRHKEVELLNTGRFAIDLNGGGKVVKPSTRRLNTATRRGFAGAAGGNGVSHRELFDQLQNGRSDRIGNNRTIEAGPNGDVHVLLHGNHVVTAHQDGSYSLFTQGWHTPTTFAVHREITGQAPNRVRGNTMFQGQPFEEGVRFNPNG